MRIFLVARGLVDHAARHGACAFASGSASSLLISYLLGLTPVDPVGCGLISEMFLEDRKVRRPPLINFEVPCELLPGLLPEIRKHFGDRVVARIASIHHYTIRYLLRALGPEFGVSAKCVQSLLKRVPMEGEFDDWAFRRAFPETRRKSAVGGLLSAVFCLRDLPREGNQAVATFFLSGDLVAGRTPVLWFEDGKMATYYGFRDLAALDYSLFYARGSAALSLIAWFTKTVRETRGLEINPNLIPWDDPMTFSQLERDALAGFQEFENRRLAPWLSELKPRCFEDLIATVTLSQYRPKIPIKEFLARHHGRRPVRFLHPLLKAITVTTQGLFFYTEQVLRSWTLLTGGDLQKALEWRREVVYKPNRDQEALRKEFVAKCQRQQGISPTECNRLYRGLCRAANSTEEKADMASKAPVLLQIAYLKAHYAREFEKAMQVDAQQMAMERDCLAKDEQALRKYARLQEYWEGVDF